MLHGLALFVGLSKVRIPAPSLIVPEPKFVTMTDTTQPSGKATDAELVDEVKHPSKNADVGLQLLANSVRVHFGESEARRVKRKTDIFILPIVKDTFVLCTEPWSSACELTCIVVALHYNQPSIPRQSLYLCSGIWFTGGSLSCRTGVLMDFEHLLLRLPSSRTCGRVPDRKMPHRQVRSDQHLPLGRCGDAMCNRQKFRWADGAAISHGNF
jgi:hypothetical protein